MSENNITDTEKTLNAEAKKTIRIAVEADFAAEILGKINAPTPDASEIDEIVLIIKK